MQGIDLALTQKKIQGVCLLCFENERPPRGALGYLDWLFAGHFTRLLKNQTLTGKKGEVLYSPILWHGETLHILIIGGGYLEHSGKRPALDQTLLDKVIGRAQDLQIESLGIVSEDWALKGNEKLISSLEKRKICVLN